MDPYDAALDAHFACDDDEEKDGLTSTFPVYSSPSLIGTEFTMEEYLSSLEGEDEVKNSSGVYDPSIPLTSLILERLYVRGLMIAKMSAGYGVELDLNKPVQYFALIQFSFNMKCGLN